MSGSEGNRPGWVMRVAVLSARAGVAVAGLVGSVLFAINPTRAQLSELGLGDALLPLAPICAGGCVLGGWYIGAEFAGVRYEPKGVAKIAEEALMRSMGALWFATGCCALFQGPAGWAHFTPIMVRVLAALILPIGFGFAAEFWPSRKPASRDNDEGDRAPGAETFTG